MDIQKEFAKIFESEKYGQILSFLDYSQEKTEIKLKWVSGAKSCNMSLKEPDGEKIVDVFNKIDKEFVESLIVEINHRHPE